jgi:hypothetical protein
MFGFWLEGRRGEVLNLTKRTSLLCKQPSTLILKTDDMTMLCMGRAMARIGNDDKRVKLEYLDVTVLRRGVREVLVVAGRAPAC